MLQQHEAHQVEAGSDDLSVVHIPLPKKSGSGPHSALADLAAFGDAPLLVVRHGRGDCITLPTKAIHSVWPFPDALKVDLEPRVALELPDRAPLGAFAQALAAAGIESLVSAMPRIPRPAVTLRTDDLSKASDLLSNTGLALAATERLNSDAAGSTASKDGKSDSVSRQLELYGQKVAAELSKQPSSSSNGSSSSSRSGSPRKSKDKSKVADKARDKSREKRKSRDRDRGKERSKDREKGKTRDRDKDKKKDRDKSRSRDRKDRDRGKDKSKSRDRDRDRDKHKDKDRDRDRDKEKDRDKDRGEKGKDKDKDKKGKDHGKDLKRSRSASARPTPKRSKPPRGGFDQKESGISALALMGVGMPGMPVMSLTADPEIEAFLAVNPVDQQAAARFRALPLELQKAVLVRGSLVGTRDPSAVLMSRVRDAMSGSTTNKGGAAGIGAAHPRILSNQMPIPAGSNPQVEAFLAENPVGYEAAQRLRALPPHIQRVVLIRGGLSATRDPSSVLMSRIRDASNMMNMMMA